LEIRFYFYIVLVFQIFSVLVLVSVKLKSIILLLVLVIKITLVILMQNVVKDEHTLIGLNYTFFDCMVTLYDSRSVNNNSLAGLS